MITLGPYFRREGYYRDLDMEGKKPPPPPIVDVEKLTEYERMWIEKHKL